MLLEKCRRNLIFKCAAMVLAAGFAWFAVHTLILLWAGFSDDAQRADVIVVLGNKVERDGTPSRRLQCRLDCALRLYREELAPVIIVSGGLGKEGHPEAEVMRDALVQAGVPADAITVDNEGVDTFSTALNTKRIMRDRRLESVIIVSSFYHIPRTRMIFERAGIGNVSSAHARFAGEWRDVYSVVREFPAFYYYWLRPVPADGEDDKA